MCRSAFITYIHLFHTSMCHILVFSCGCDHFTLSNMFYFGLLLCQCWSSGPFLKDRPHSCEKGEVWGAKLSSELRARLGGAARRGSAPAIDTLRATHIAHLHALNESQRPVGSTPAEPEDGSGLRPPELHAEAEDDPPSQSPRPQLQLPPVPSLSEHRRLSDAIIRPQSEASSEKCSLPVPRGRRHSDLSSLLCLTSHHDHRFAMHINHACQACLSLLLLRSREGSHCHPSAFTQTHPCPCELRHHPLPGGAAATPGCGQLRGSGDASDFSLLQQSLLNIISRKAAPCPTTPATPARASVLQVPPVHRPVCSDGDGRLKSRPLCGSLVGVQKPPQDGEDRFFARGPPVTAAAGVVGHLAYDASFPLGGNPANGCNSRSLLDRSIFHAWS